MSAPIYSLVIVLKLVVLVRFSYANITKDVRVRSTVVKNRKAFGFGDVSISRSNVCYVNESVSKI